MSQRRKAAPASQRTTPRRSQGPQDEEEDSATFSQITPSQAQRARENFTKEQLERKVTEVVQFILIKDQKKIPIRRADIIKNVVKEYRAVYQDILSGVGRTFEKVFGLKLVVIDAKTHIYILVNNLPPAPDIMSPNHPKTGLLLVILSAIFMKGGVLKEQPLWNMLKKLRLDPGEKHSEIGDVKKLITDEFVRQRYLEYVKIPHTEPVEFEFRWGQRSEKEVSKTNLLEFVGEIFEQDPQNWTQQYRDAHGGQSGPV